MAIIDRRVGNISTALSWQVSEAEGVVNTTAPGQAPGELLGDLTSSEQAPCQTPDCPCQPDWPETAVEDDDGSPE